jgi:Arc/MetJ-type ribon-helix-helix transcriptional regulator
MKEATMQRTTFYIPKAQYTEFHKACIDAHRPMSDVVRELINRWLQEQKKASREAGKK